MQWQARHTPIWATIEWFDKRTRRSVDHTRLCTVTILRDEIPWPAFNYAVCCHQMILRIDINCYSTVWRSICTTWRVFLPFWWCSQSIALVLGSILRTIDCVYLLFSGWKPPFAELKPWQSEQWHLLYCITSVAWSLSTARPISSHIGWFHSLDNLTTNQLAPRCMKSER